MFRYQLHIFFFLLCLVSSALARRDNVVHPKPYHAPAGSQFYTRDKVDDLSMESMLPWQDRTVEGLTAIDSFSYKGEMWKSYEDLTRFDGPLVLVSASRKRREITRHADGPSI